MSKKSVLKMTALAAVFAASASVPMTAAAEVSANLGISNIYLWRGQDISDGGAVVHGGLEYGTEAGLYGGVWGTSESGGSEYDLYVGYGTEIGGLSIDLSYWTYVYPNPVDDTPPGDLAEVVLGLGFGGLSATAYIGVQDLEDYKYYTLGYEYDKYSVLVGLSDDDGDKYTHVDLSYAFNENLSFTLSKITEADAGSGVTSAQDVQFLVSYSFAF